MMEQHSQCATHIRGIHLCTCISCQICGNHTYHSIDFSCHLEAKDVDKESEWFAPLPDLSNVAIKQKVKEEEVEDLFTEYNIAGVRETNKFKVITIDLDTDSE